jgi:hypothetical protein
MRLFISHNKAFHADALPPCSWLSLLANRSNIFLLSSSKRQSAGELNRWSVALRPTNGETVNSQGAGSAQAPTNPHSNGRIK